LRDDDDWPRALLQYFLNSVIPPALGAEMEMASAGEHDEVVRLGRQGDLVLWDADLLEHRARDVLLGRTPGELSKELLDVAPGILEETLVHDTQAHQPGPDGASPAETELDGRVGLR
jgi:hypothetical protein